MKKRWVFPVSDKRLLWCQERIKRYKHRDRSNVIELSSTHDMKHDLGVLRRNHLHKQLADISAKVTPTMFRASAHNLIKTLLTEELYGRIPHIKVGIFPWRAGLAFLELFTSIGLRFPTVIYHIGASRDEATLKTKIYFDEPPDLLCRNAFDRNLPVHFYIMDPMLASSNTTLTIIKRLFKYNVGKRSVADDMVTVMSIFSAPEGIVRLVEEYSDIRIVTAVIDERLNARGFIEPGMGDFGDQYHEGLTINHYQNQRRWFSDRAFQALDERLKK